jgi:peptidyl-prolyl cis-trans isomerase B (cyclophilin B)
MTILKTIAACIAAALAVVLTSVAPTMAAPSTDKSANPVVVMVVAHNGKTLGNILIELYPKDAPISTANFLKLVNKKFYNGLTFHRVADLGSPDSPGKIIQGGDPKGDGTGGPGWTIKGEFSDNGVKNTLTHNAGAFAMARSQDPDSAGSQFYICIDPVHPLDGHYAVFGQVIKGLDIAKKVVQGDKIVSVTVK